MSNSKEAPIRFFPEQIRWLEKMFPERVFPPDASEAALREYFGIRKVVLACREKEGR